MPASEPKLSLVAKLAAIMGEIGNIEKGGTNTAQNYKFVRESDVVAKVLPLLVKYNVILHSSVISIERDELYETRSGNKMWITTVGVQGTWMDGDTGDTLPAATFYGTGADTGDKGVYKAMTGAGKYLLLKSLLISTGDDPEADEKVDRTEAAQGAARGSRVASNRRPQSTSQPGTTRGGRSAVTTNPQMDELGRLARTAGFDVAKLAAFVGGALSEPAIHEGSTGEELKAYLEKLPADKMGQLILALTAVAEPAEKDDDADPFGGSETESTAGNYGG